MLQALQPLIAEGLAILEPLETGSFEAIKDALEAEPFHVLHYTGHASPGHLLMEGPDGEDAPVGQENLAELLSRFPTLRLVVLSGCATASSFQLAQEDSTGANEAPENKDSETALRQPEALQGFAQALSGLGIDFVVGMQESIPDQAATSWAGSFYRHLVRGHADVPAAFQSSRRSLKNLEQEQPAEQGNWGQWPLPVLYQRGLV